MSSLPEKTDVQQSASNVHTEASKSMHDLRFDPQTSRHQVLVLLCNVTIRQYHADFTTSWLCTFSGQRTDGPYLATSGRTPRGISQTSLVFSFQSSLHFVELRGQVGQHEDYVDHNEIGQHLSEEVAVRPASAGKGCSKYRCLRKSKSM